MKFFLSLLFLISSCTDYSEVKESISKSHLIAPEPLEIVEAENITWNVGPQKMTALSQGIQVVFSLPKIEEEKMQILYKKYGFDSWIYEVIQLKNSREIKLGSFYIPFSFKREKLDHQPERTGFKVIYAPLYSVASLANSRCPLKGHDKFINKLEIKSVPTSSSYKTIELTSYSTAPYNGEPEKAHYSLNAVNGGSSLVAEYSIRLALFNQAQNKVISRFIYYPQKVVVLSEEMRLVKGCAGVDQRPPSEKPKIQMKDFKFGS